MSRPRSMTSKYCLQCRVIPQTPEQVENRAKHRMDHRRLDKRRAQYRAAKQRKRVADGRIGALHDLGCTASRCRCRPIPVYSKKDVAA